MKSIKKIYIKLFLCGSLICGSSLFAQTLTIKKNADQITSPTPRSISPSGNVTAGFIAGVPFLDVSLSASVNDTRKQTELNYLKEDNAKSLILGAGSGISSSVNFVYNSKIPRNTPFYIRLKQTSDGLLNGLLGGAVGGFLNSSLISNHVVNVNVYDTSTVIPVNAYSTDNYFTQLNPTDFAFMYSPDGKPYLKIVPTADYKTVEFHETNTGLLSGLLSTSRSEIEFGYYYEGVNKCDVPVFTSWNATGGLLSLLSTDDVINPHQAIDQGIGSDTTGSQIGGVKAINVDVAGTISQTFHLPELISDKEVKLKIGFPSKIVSLDIASSPSVEFYNGDSLVGTVVLDSNFLNIDLLELINGDTNTFVLKLAPKDSKGDIIPYNNVKFVLKLPVGLSLGQGESIYIYDFTTIAPDPIVTEVCTKEFIVNGIRETKFDITTIIPNYDTATAYTITNTDNQVIDMSNVNNRWQPLGSYTIKGITNSTEYCANETVALVAVQDTSNRLTGKTSIALKLDTSTLNTSQHTFLASDYQIYTDSPTVNVTNQYTINVYNENTLDTVTGTTVVFDKVGTYNYFVKATKGDCEIVKRITVYVYDTDGCDYRYVQNTASKESAGTVSLLGIIPLGGTSESARSIDTDLSTHGSVFNVVSLLGIGTTYQNLYFTNGADTSTNKIITAGTPVTIKLGQDFGVAQVIGGITVQALDNAGNRIGKLLSIGETDLLNVLAGDNVFEYTFVPQSDSGTAVAYSGVRINLGSVLGVGNNLKVYGAYIDERKSLAEAGICEDNLLINGAEVGPATNQQDVQLRLNRTTKDVLYGTQDLGLGVATALSSVVYPYLAADAIDSPTSEFHGLPNYSTGALFNTSVSALNRMTLTVKFRDIARPGDKVRVVLGKEDASILDLNVLGGALSAQRYMGNVAIGDPYVIQSTALVELDLLGLLGSNGFNKSIIEIPGIGAPFDRIELGVNSLVNADLLAPKLRVYDVSVVPYFEFDSGTTQETTLLCTSAPFEVEKLDPCFTYELSYAYATGDSSTVVRYIDIDSSTVQMVRNNDDVAQYKLTTSSKIAPYNSADNLYLKVVTRRAGCIYGNANYLKVKVASCGAISNPMIRTRLQTN